MKNTCYNKSAKNLIFVAFGAGCAVALCLPTVWTTRILALCVIVLGIICCRPGR